MGHYFSTFNGFMYRFHIMVFNALFAGIANEYLNPRKFFMENSMEIMQIKK